MNALRQKEMRWLLPVWLAVLGLMGLFLLITAGFGGDLATMQFLGLVLGCAVLAASLWGQEFHYQTLPLLLLLPVQRRRIWMEKSCVLAAAIGMLIVLAVAVMSVSEFRSKNWVLLLFLAFWPGLIAFCGGPYWTLVTRNTLHGLVFSLAVPGLISVGGGVLIHWALEPRWPEWLPFTLDNGIQFYVFASLLSYAALIYWLGYRKFLGYEFTGASSVIINLPWARKARFGLWLCRRLPARWGGLVSLVFKELRLQQVVFLIAGCLVLLWGVLLVAKSTPSSPPSALAPALYPLFMGLMPLMVGAVAVAEERSYGVLEWQLSQPLSAWRQWTVKVTIALALGLLLGQLLPRLLLTIDWTMSHEVGLKDLVHFTGTPESWLAVWLCVLFGLFSSSTVRNSLKAVLFAAGLSLVVALAFFVMARPIGGQLYGWVLGLAVPQRQAMVVWLGWIQPLVLIAAFPLSLLLLLIPAYLNYRYAPLSFGRQAILGVALSICISFGLEFYLDFCEIVEWPRHALG